MRSRGTQLLALLGLLAAAACRKAPPPEPGAPAAEAAAESPAEAPATAAASPGPATGPPVTAASPAYRPPSYPIIAVRTGSGLSPEGELADGKSEFRPGEEVSAVVDVSLLPAGAVVKVSWYDAAGAPRGEEQKTVAEGRKWLAFVAPGAYNWPEGSYRVDVIASTGGIASASFRIAVPPPDVPTGEPG